MDNYSEFSSDIEHWCNKCQMNLENCIKRNKTNLNINSPQSALT